LRAEGTKATIITAFLPIFTFERVEGKIFTPVTYTLSFALIGAILRGIWNAILGLFGLD